MPRCERPSPFSTVAPDSAPAAPDTRHDARDGSAEPAPARRWPRTIRSFGSGRFAGCFGVAVAAWSAVLCGPAAAEAQEWRYNLKLYGWVPALSATLGTPLGNVNVDQSMSDVLDQLDFALFGTFEAQRGRWSLIGDLAHSKLSQTETLLPPAPFGGVRLETRLTAISGYVAYRVAETEMVGLDLAAGFRHYDLSLRAALTGPALQIRNADSWTDPVIGARATFEFGQGWRGALSLDVGGFGIGSASDLSWQATAEVEYAFNDTWSALVGYRHLSIDRPAAKQPRKLELSGPVIGVRARF